MNGVELARMLNAVFADTPSCSMAFKIALAQRIVRQYTQAAPVAGVAVPLHALGLGTITAILACGRN